ncbi:MAG: beta-lactamase family protein [Oscillospiraceae bacterium]|nr:beta-lactamase family protein [Oscillospiraceae bacterium]
MERNPELLTGFLQQEMEKKGYTGVSVCIRGPEGILYEHGFGSRSVKKGTAVNPDTVFGIASMSKSFTALSCCILAAEGKMSLDDPMVKYFPGLHLPGVPDELVTVRQVALHRAGIPPMEPLEWSIAMNTNERESEWIRRMRKEAPNPMNTIDQIVEYISQGRYRTLGEPGEYMSYSNEGYALLSYVVDQAAGMPLEQFLMERIFRPLGMTRSILDEDASGIRALIGDDNITSLYDRGENGELLEDDVWSILPPFRGCACIKTTSRDVTRYYQMLSDGGRFEGRQIIPAEAVELLVGREFPVRVKPFDCMGLRKRLMAGRVVCEHGGALHGVSTHGGFLEGGYACAALCNDSDVDMAPFFWVLCNYVMGLPLETEHNWCNPCGRRFSAEEMLFGDYVGHEGIVAHCLVYRDGEGQLVYRNSDGDIYDLQYCEGTVFAAFSRTTGERVNTLRFFLRDGHSWAVKCGTRIFQRA